MVSSTSSRSSVRKPSLKAKPSALQGNSLDRNDDYLNDNLLAEGDEEDSMSESPKLSHRTPAYDAGSNRLVIAIDYGTTFTGEL